MSDPTNASLIEPNDLMLEVTSMDPLPVTASRLAALLTGDRWELHQVGEILKLDPALTARILSVANSAAHAGVQSVTEVSEAVMRLGAGTVLSLTMAAGAQKTLGEPLHVYGAGPDVLWRHSLAAALATQSMRQKARLDVPNGCFAAALLHDLGKVVLCHHLGPDALVLLKRAEAEGGESQTEAESELLAVNHGELGGLVAQHWRLPVCIVTPIIYHHAPERAPEHTRACQIVQLADAIAKEIGAGIDDGSPASTDDFAELRETLSISDDQHEQICELTTDRLTETLESF